MCVGEKNVISDPEWTLPRSCMRIAPVLRDASKLYIYGTDDRSARLFFQLCSLRIPIEGFVCGSVDEGVTFFHRPVYQEAGPGDDVRVLVPGDAGDLGGGIPEGAAYLDITIKDHDVVVYGGGACGRALTRYLKKKGIDVRYFIDSGADKDGTSIDGIPVYGPDILRSLPDGTTVIEAGRYWREIDAVIAQMNSRLKDRFYIDMPMLRTLSSMEEKEILLDAERNIRIPCADAILMASLEKNFPGKGFILYGTNTNLLRRYDEIYRMLGYEGFIITTEEDVSEHIRIGRDILLVQNIDKARALDRLAPGGTLECVPVNAPRKGGGVRKFCYDINLGHTYQYDDGQFGIRTYGEEKEDDHRIVVLGNSTTEYGRDAFPSWVECLYERYLKEAHVTVYNCAVGGYTSTQELIKFLRDGMRLEPDMVVSYSGITDAYFERYHGMSTYSFPYLNKVFHNGSDGRDIANGLPDPDSHVDDWLFNMRCMDAVAGMCGITFLAFIQPSLGNREPQTVNEQEIMLMDRVLYPEGIFAAVREFRASAKAMAGAYGSIHDLSDIFDHKDVYIDSCHVNREGQEIIADEIWKRIRENAAIESCQEKLMTEQKG